MDAPVLLLMDYQEGICRPDGVFGANGTGAEVVRRGVLRARGHRARSLPRSQPTRRARPPLRRRCGPPHHELEHRLRHDPRSRADADGDPATAICAEVAPSPDEPVIARCGFGPFAGTNLEGVLHRAHPTELVMGGVTTNHVVESAVRHASDIGFSVVVLEDLCACDSAEAHRYAIQESCRATPSSRRATSTCAIGDG